MPTQTGTTATPSLRSPIKAFTTEGTITVARNKLVRLVGIKEEYKTSAQAGKRRVGVTIADTSFKKIFWASYTPLFEKISETYSISAGPAAFADDPLKAATLILPEFWVPFGFEINQDATQKQTEDNLGFFVWYYEEADAT